MKEKNEKYLRALEAAINENINYEKLDGKAVLVTGATGLIGKALVDYLFVICDKYKIKMKIYAASRSEDSFNARFEKREGLFYFNYTLTEKADTKIRFDYIIHSASNADPKMFDADPVGTMTSNFAGAYNLLEYARQNKTQRLLFVSSGEVYGQWDGECDAFGEDYSGYVDFGSVRGCYPSAKRAAENLCVCYGAQYGVDTVIVRPSHTYGPTQLKRDSRAVSEFFNCAIEGRDIVLKSKGLTVRSYTCVFDCVSGIVTALLNGKSGEAYNIANKESVVSIGEAAQMIAGCAGKKVVFDIPDGGVRGAGNIARGVLDGTKLESIGWKPVFDIEKGIRTTYEIMEADK